MRQVLVCQSEKWGGGLLAGCKQGTAVIFGCDRGGEGVKFHFKTPGVCLREPKIA